MLRAPDDPFLSAAARAGEPHAKLTLAHEQSFNAVPSKTAAPFLTRRFPMPPGRISTDPHGHACWLAAHAVRPEGHTAAAAAAAAAGVCVRHPNLSLPPRQLLLYC
jgi:hypothetical protein